MAGTSNYSDDDDSITGINVTPLVDIMLVLLIIFMVTSNYINSQAINLSLPKAATGEVVESTNLGFTLSKDSELFLEGKPVSFEDIAQVVAQRRERAGGQALQALIAADQGTPHGDVVKLIDAVRKSGITDFAINVEVEAQTPQP